MTKISLHRNTEFIVGEEKVLNYVMAFLFLALFLYGLADAIARKFTNIDYQSLIFTIALLPAVIFFKKARSKRIFIRINKKGIYRDERLLTDWDHFIRAYLDQEQKVVSIKDNFVLVVEYKKGNAGDAFRQKIPLTNTQNQSEEDVLAAVNFFEREFLKDKSSFPRQ